jgi:O-antigen/teichoic acid export membrane protein
MSEPTKISINPSQTKSIFTHSMIYASGMVAQKLIGFVMIPIYTRYLLPEDYGVLELLTTTFEIIGIFTAMGLTASMTRYYYNYKEIKDRNSVVSTALILAFFTYPLSLSCVFLFSENISIIVFGKDSYSDLLQIMIANFLFTSLLEFPLAYLRIKEKSVRFVVLSLIRFLIALSLNIYFVIILKLAVKGILYSGLITSGLLSTYLIAVTLRDVGFTFSLKKAKEMIRYGIPMAFSFLGGFILTFSDRYFLRVYSSLSEVGIYSLAYRFAGVIPFLIVTPFLQIWGPKRFELATQNDAETIFKKLFHYYAFGLISSGLLLALFIKPTIFLVTTPLYYKAHDIVPILVISYIFYGFVFIANTGILISNKTIYLSFAYTISSIICMGCNFFLIRGYGAAGAAWATVIAYFVLLISTYWFAQYLHHFNYDWSKILKMSFIAIVIYLSGSIYEPDDLYLMILQRLILLNFYALYIIISPYFSHDDKKIVVGIIIKPFLNIKHLIWHPSIKK